jgi:hypothetical protein
MNDTIYVILKNGAIQGAVLNSNTLATRAMNVMRVTDFDDAQKKDGLVKAMQEEGPLSNLWEIIPTTLLKEGDI